MMVGRGGVGVTDKMLILLTLESEKVEKSGPEHKSKQNVTNNY